MLISSHHVCIRSIEYYFYDHKFEPKPNISNFEQTVLRGNEILIWNNLREPVHSERMEIEENRGSQACHLNN